MIKIISTDLQEKLRCGFITFNHCLMACNDVPAICRGMQELYKNTVKIYLLKILPVIIAGKINNVNPDIIIILQRSESIFFEVS